MKKTFILATLASAIFTTQALAADASSNTLTTSQDFKTLKEAPTTAASAPATTPATDRTASKHGLFKGGAKIVPDTSPAAVAASNNALKKADQGYSNMSAYNVVNDQNKPVTQDWTRPKSWRIGYKNKNRTPINE